MQPRCEQAGISPLGAQPCHGVAQRCQHRWVVKAQASSWTSQQHLMLLAHLLLHPLRLIPLRLQGGAFSRPLRAPVRCLPPQSHLQHWQRFILCSSRVPYEKAAIFHLRLEVILICLALGKVHSMFIKCTSAVQMASKVAERLCMHALRPAIVRNKLIALPLAGFVKGSSPVSELMPGRSRESSASCTLLDSEPAPVTPGILPTLT